MGFTGWIDKRIAVAVDRAVADANAAAAQDMAKVLAAFDALPAEVAKALQELIDTVVPGFLRHTVPQPEGMEKRDAP